MNETTEILKIDTKGRVRTPREKQEEILHEFEASGMTGRQFARHVGIKYPTLMSWVQRRKVERPDSIGTATDGVKPERAGFQTRQWIEAVVQDVRTSFVVEVAGGLALNIGSENEAKLAAVVLRGLGYGRPC
jgi:transposase